MFPPNCPTDGDHLIVRHGLNVLPQAGHDPLAAL